MASCYGSIAPPEGSASLSYLPVKMKLKDGTAVEIDVFRGSEHEAGRLLLNHVINEGLSWPFEEEMDMDAFRAYFLSHAAFVVRACPGNSSDSSETASETTPNASISIQNPGVTFKGVPAGVMGAFYIKPNFPGRCSHICNGGFITHPKCRRRGVAHIMGKAFLRFAKDLGYKASYFNLVFSSNEASVRLWRSLGFQELAIIPSAGRLKGVEGLVDAIQFYYNLEFVSDVDGLFLH